MTKITKKLPKPSKYKYRGNVFSDFLVFENFGQKGQKFNINFAKISVFVAKSDKIFKNKK